MLTGFRVENFKNFQDTSHIDLAPLTLLSGINSAGKSSLIQMLLLLKQTLDSGPSQVLNPSQGPFLGASLGDNLNDFLFGRPKLSEATLTYHLTFAYDPNHEHETELYEALDALLTALAVQLRGKLKTQVVVTYDWGSLSLKGRADVRVANLQIRLSLDEYPLVGLQFNPVNGQYQVTGLLDATDDQLKDLAFTQLQIGGMASFLPDFLVISGQQPKEVPLEFARLFSGLFSAVRRDLSEHIYYLNSFRIPPQRLYASGGTAGIKLNTNGENFAQVFWRYREEPVSFVHPNGTQSKLPLSEMLGEVLADTLGLKQRVQIKPVGEGLGLLEVKLESLGPRAAFVTLADVGLGYNQVLPMIIQGLLTPPGALVIFEQPEIHLHPEVQARLINFFAGLARAGRRVLVETHSTFMVDHLCLSIVKDRSNWLAENSSVLFIHPPDENHASARIEPVQINRYGKILNYPPHFLPDIAAIYGEILKEGFAKRREEKTSATKENRS